MTHPIRQMMAMVYRIFFIFVCKLSPQAPSKGSRAAKLVLLFQSYLRIFPIINYQLLISCLHSIHVPVQLFFQLIVLSNGVDDVF